MLSDLITQLVAAQTAENWDRFLRATARSHLGVVARGLKPDAQGMVRADGTIGLARTSRGHLSSLLLTAADFEIFRERYPQQGFNAGMAAVDVFRTALADAGCQGILVNSAASAHSIPIQRDKIQELVEALRTGAI